MKYRELKEKQAKELNEFKGIFFAFSNEQLKEGLKKVGLKENETDKICSIGAGGYLLKTVAKDFHKMFENAQKEIVNAMLEKDFLISAFAYELSNHEFLYTREYEQTLDCFDLKFETLTSLQKECLEIATKLQFKNSEN